MSGIAQLLAGLEGRGIILSLADGELRYRSPREALTAADRETLRARKAAVIAFLKAREAGRALKAARGGPGPLTASVAQEMWWRFAGMPDEGKPVALNIGMVGTFPDTDAATLTRTVRDLIDRHEALRVAFRAEGEALTASLLPARELVIEQLDLRALTAADAAAETDRQAREFCARLNPILGGWLTRARVVALPDGASQAVISAAHMIADAGTRNIVIGELRAALEGESLPASVPYNDFSLAERAVLAGPEGGYLIGYWRDWYRAQPTMTAPTTGTPLLWGNGTRILRNFAIPKRMMDRARALAARLKVMPFLVFLTIFAVTMARWSGLSRFPIRVLGDKRTAVDLANTVGLMFCADAVAVDAPPEAGFETVLRAILAEYDAALARRIPTLHFYAPQMVRPGIEPPGFPNRIPAVFNYYAVGTAWERAQKTGADTTAAWPWPPRVEELPPQIWPRVSSPLFLHLMDYGAEAAASLHFYADVIGAEDRDSFTARLFAAFDEFLPS